MKKIFYRNLILALLLLLSSCASPINERTASIHYDAGLKSESMGDYEAAKQHFYRAYESALLANSGTRAEAYALYEWSRVSGYSGDTEAARDGFEKVINLLKEDPETAEDLMAPCLAELCRLLYDTKQYDRAAKVFPMTILELEKVGIQDSDPIGYASFLDDYAGTLDQIGNSDMSKQIEGKASKLRNEHPDKVQLFFPKRYKSSTP